MEECPHPDVIKAFVLSKNSALLVIAGIGAHIQGCQNCQNIMNQYEAKPNIDLVWRSGTNDLLESRGPRFHQVQ